MIKPCHIGYERVWTGTVGKFDYTYYTRDDLTNTDPEKVRDVQGWLSGLDEPWSPTAVSYTIHPSYETGHIPEDEIWVCDYTSIVYDGIESHVRVVAATPEEAFEKCQKLLKELLETYYITPPEEEDE